VYDQDASDRGAKSETVRQLQSHYELQRRWLPSLSPTRRCNSYDTHLVDTRGQHSSSCNSAGPGVTKALPPRV
jgi:hypothetical protein